MFDRDDAFDPDRETRGRRDSLPSGSEPPADLVEALGLDLERPVNVQYVVSTSKANPKPLGVEEADPRWADCWNRSDWVILNADIEEQLSAPYSVSLHVKVEEEADPAPLLGADLTLTIERFDVMGRPAHRHFAGIVESVRHSAIDRGWQELHLVMVPAFAILQHRVRTRVFQEEGKSAKDILLSVLEEDLALFGRKLDASALEAANAVFSKRDFCVQYDESDFAFCSRLMEEEGISYYFEHSEEGEILVLLPPPTPQSPNAGFPQLQTLDGGPVFIRHSDERGIEYIESFCRDSRMRPSAAELADWDWTRNSIVEARVDLKSEDARLLQFRPSRGLHYSGFDRFSGYAENDLDHQQDLHRKTQLLRANVCAGQGSVAGMQPGMVFELVGHGYLDDRYVITRVEHTNRGSDYGYGNRFECVPASTPIVPERWHEKPRIHGIQTAIVCGDESDPIHTDAYGRVKLRFHWDNTGGAAATVDRMWHANTCWVRVQQAMAGGGWGHSFIPYVGMEVVVSFINGDIDRPVVTGCLQNQENFPRYDYPDEKRVSGISTFNDNELRFDDTDGAEEILVHARRNLVVEAENDRNQHIQNCESNVVDKDQSELIKQDQFLTVDRNRGVHVKGKFTETIDAAEERTVTGGSTETINDGHTVTVNGDHSETVNGDRSLTVNGARTETVSGAVTELHRADSSRLVSGNSMLGVSGNRTENVSGHYTTTVVGGMTIASAECVNIMAPCIRFLGGTEFEMRSTSFDAIGLEAKAVGIEFKTAGVCADVVGIHTEALGVYLGVTGVKLDKAVTTVHTSTIMLFN